MFHIVVTYYMRDTERFTVDSLDILATLPARQVSSVTVTATGGD